MATCFGRPFDHHQANFNKSCACIVLTIWDPIMCTCVKTFNSDFSPYIENNVHIMGSHIVSTMKAHDLLKFS